MNLLGDIQVGDGRGRGFIMTQVKTQPLIRGSLELLCLIVGQLSCIPERWSLSDPQVLSQVGRGLSVASTLTWSSRPAPLNLPDAVAL